MGVSTDRLVNVGDTKILTVTMTADEVDNNVSWPPDPLDEDRIYKLILSFDLSFKVNMAVTDYRFGLNLHGANGFAAAVWSRYVSTGQDTAFDKRQGQEYGSQNAAGWLTNPATNQAMQGLLLPPGMGLTIGGMTGTSQQFDMAVSMCVATARDPMELWPFIGAKTGISNAVQ